MSITVSDFLIQRLNEWGIRRIFGFPGDGINGFIKGAIGRAGEKAEWDVLNLAALVYSAPENWGDERHPFRQRLLSMLVAVIGTSLSAYLYTWQSNVEVEEKIASGRKRLSQRKGATEEELKGSRFDILGGMLFSNVIMYFIILSTSATLFEAGKTDINTAADAASASSIGW
jgi:Mn2+/Fe2+ NRAMP family transporter